MTERESTSPDGWGRRKYVTAAEAATFLAVNVRTIHRYAQAGRLTPHYIQSSRAVRFLRTEVENLIGPTPPDPDRTHPTGTAPDPEEGPA